MKELKIIVNEPADSKAFNERMAKVMIETFKNICPKELQLAVIENLEKRMAVDK